MSEPVRAWESSHPLSQLSLGGDWDSLASMIASLRLHLFEWGTVPTWNFAMCGGRPELAIPYSWTWTWPSALAYLLPPNQALLALWVLMSAVGFAATRSLLRGWSGSSLGATTGAFLFVASGYFAARFNVGHATYAFFHGVPVLMLAFERGLARAAAGEPRVRDAALLLLASFAFASAGLPHALIYFYPVFALFACLLVGASARRGGPARALRDAGPLALAHALGLLLAAYKLWPVVRWQLDHPGRRVVRESNRAAEVLADTLALVPDYFHPEILAPHHAFPEAEYNAFVGPLPWLLAALAVGLSLLRARRRRSGAAPAPDERPRPLATGFGVALVAIGFSLALGAEHPASLSALVASLPVLSAARAFVRYEVLIVFGLAILTAQSFPLLLGRVRGARAARAAGTALALGCCAPVALQAGLLVWNLPAEPFPEILAQYRLEQRAADAPPALLAPAIHHTERSGQLTAMLSAGYWPGNCRSDLVLPRRGLRVRQFTKLELSQPPPLRARIEGTWRMLLEYPREATGEVALNLRVLDPSQLDVACSQDAKTRIVRFRAEDLTRHRLELDGHYPGPVAGARASALALGLSGLFLVWRHRASRPA